MHLHMTYFAGKTPQIERLPISDATVVRSAISDDMFNYVLSAHFTEQNVAARIEHVIRLFQEQGLPFSWWVGESDTPPNLKDELSRLGLIFKEQNVGMILELMKHFHRQAANRLTFKQVLQLQDLKDFGHIIQAIGGHPECYDRIYRNIPLEALRRAPLEMHIAYLEKQPIATGVLVFDDSLVGIYYVAVVPEQRGNGYGTAMMEHLLNIAKQKGYSLAGLEASHAGKSLYKRLGFREICIFEEYGWSKQ